MEHQLEKKLVREAGITVLMLAKSKSLPHNFQLKGQWMSNGIGFSYREEQGTKICGQGNVRKKPLDDI